MSVQSGGCHFWSPIGIGPRKAFVQLEKYACIYMSFCMVFKGLR